MAKQGTGRIGIRLTLAVVFAALVPLVVAVPLAGNAIQQSTGRFFVPEIRERLDQSLELYTDLAQTVKAGMRHQATALVRDDALVRAAASGERASIQRELERQLKQFPELVSVTVLNPEEEEIAQAARAAPVDEAKEHELRVVRPLGSDGTTVMALFATPRHRFEQRNQMSRFVDEYSQIEERRSQDERAYLSAFATLLGVTILLAGGVGLVMARGVSGRVAALAEATRKVGAGDLSVRVTAGGTDELADLATAFNRMVEEVESSRARIEYLRRVAAWQEMARRLAHEIKNPLTPIQLAVQEIHGRYRNADTEYQHLLDTTLEIVEAEVGTLRRLVSEFSDFARLPEAHLEPVDLCEYLLEQAEQFGCGVEEEHAVDPRLFDVEGKPFKLRFRLPTKPVMVGLDRQMFRRVLVNLIRNALQAAPEPGVACIHVSLSHEPGRALVAVDDNGPGIPVASRESIFDPYVTNKSGGTGLGLAIVKKVVMEHQGSISATDSALGGARVAVRLPSTS